MKASKIILNETFAINDRYRITLYAIEVPESKKFPSGVKTKFILIDVLENAARLLIDNHEPFGYHMHTHLPEDSSIRVKLPVTDHSEALNLFMNEVERIVNHDRR